MPESEDEVRRMDHQPWDVSQSIPEVALSVKSGEAYTPAHSEKRESFKVDKDMVNFKC